MKFLKAYLFLLLSLIYSSVSCAKDFVPSMLQKMSQGRLTYEMAEIVAEKISYASLFKEAYNKANDFSVEICGVAGEERHSRDEVDAIRHFIGASILSSELGAEYVTRLLTAHENRTEILNDENYMDINNNQLGIEFGPSIPYVETINKRKSKQGWRKHKVMKRDHSFAFFKKEVEKRVASGHLFTLETGKSLCANPSVYPNMAS